MPGIWGRSNVTVSVSQVEILWRRSWKSYKTWAKELPENAAKSKAPFSSPALQTNTRSVLKGNRDLYDNTDLICNRGLIILFRYLEYINIYILWDLVFSITDIFQCFKKMSILYMTNNLYTLHFQNLQDVIINSGASNFNTEHCF